jgi:hypothetical protein
MSDDLNFDRVLDDWSSVVTCPSHDEINELLREEYPELEGCLRWATLVDVNNLPPDDFGPLGGALVWMTDKQFLWLLPVLLRSGQLSNEPVFGASVINEIIERFSRSPEWPQVKKRLSPDTIQRLLLLSEQCILLGWDDQKRINRRKDSCKAIFRQEE